MWGCMTASYTANLVFIDGVLDRYKHIDILKNKLKDNSHKLELLEDLLLSTGQKEWIVRVYNTLLIC